MKRLRLGGALAVLVALLATGQVARAGEAALTLTRTGAIAPGGTYGSIAQGDFATVSGTVTCYGAEWAIVAVGVAQGEGSTLTTGAGRVSVACTGDPEGWAVNVYSQGRPFSTGEASACVYASPYPWADGSTDARAEATIRLQ